MLLILPRLFVPQGKNEVNIELRHRKRPSRDKILFPFYAREARKGGNLKYAEWRRPYMCEKWANLSVIEKLGFISRLNAIEVDLVFNSIGKEKLANVLWILQDEFQASLDSAVSVTDAADFFLSLPKNRRDKLL